MYVSGLELEKELNVLKMSVSNFNEFDLFLVHFIRLDVLLSIGSVYPLDRDAAVVDVDAVVATDAFKFL